MGAERRLIDAIHRRLPVAAIHRQSMTGSTGAMNGTPDYYYDGKLGLGSDLWIEYKALTAMPRNGIVVGALTALQLAWLKRRYRPKMPNAAVIVGLPNRKVALQRTPAEWENGTAVETAISLEEAAQWITDFCSQSSE